MTRGAQPSPVMLHQRDRIDRREVAVTLCTVGERRHARQNRQPTSDGHCGSRKTAGASIENFKSSKDGPNGAIPTRPQRNEKVCRERMLWASLTPRRARRMQRQHPQTALQRDVAERHSYSRVSPKAEAGQLGGQGAFVLLFKFPQFPEHLATKCPLRFLSNLCHRKHLLKRASP